MQEILAGCVQDDLASQTKSSRVDALRRSLEYFEETRPTIRAAQATAMEALGEDGLEGGRSSEHVREDIQALELAMDATQQQEIGSARNAFQAPSADSLSRRQAMNRAVKLQKDAMQSELDRLQDELDAARTREAVVTKKKSTLALNRLARPSWDSTASRMKTIVRSLEDRVRRLDVEERSMRIDVASESRRAREDILADAIKNYEAMSEEYRKTLDSGLHAGATFLASSQAPMAHEELALGTELQTLARSGYGISARDLASIERSMQEAMDDSHERASRQAFGKIKEKIASLCASHGVSLAGGAGAKGKDEEASASRRDALDPSLRMWDVLRFAREQMQSLGFFRLPRQQQLARLRSRFTVEDLAEAKEQFATAETAMKQLVPSSQQGTGRFIPFVIAQGRDDVRAVLAQDEDKLRRLRERYYRLGWDTKSWLEETPKPVVL